MTEQQVDDLLLKHVFEVDPAKPPQWYLDLHDDLCVTWSGLGLVVEEMEKKRPRWLCMLDQNDNDWQAFFQQKETYKTAEAFHQKPPMAVAIAALRAVGMEIPEEEVLR